MSVQPPRPLVSSLRLAALLSAVGFARHFTRYVLDEWRFDDALSETACLLVSEVMTNAIKATGCIELDPDLKQLSGVPSVRLQLQANEGGLLAEVWDCDASSVPTMQEQHSDAVYGRGLLLITEMSHNWGYYHPPIGGKVVWFQLVRPVQQIDITIEEDGVATLPHRNRQPSAAITAHHQNQADVALLERTLAGLMRR